MYWEVSRSRHVPLPAWFKNLSKAEVLYLKQARSFFMQVHCYNYSTSFTVNHLLHANCLLSLCMCNCKNSVVLDGWPLFKLNWVRFGPPPFLNIWESMWFDWIKRLKTNRVNLLFLYLLQQLYMHCIMSVSSSVPTPTAKSCNYDTKARRLDFPWSSS